MLFFKPWLSAGRMSRIFLVGCLDAPSFRNRTLSVSVYIYIYIYHHISIYINYISVYLCRRSDSSLLWKHPLSRKFSGNMAEKLSTMSVPSWPSSTFRYPTVPPCQALAMECANEVPCDRIRVEVQEASADSIDSSCITPLFWLESTWSLPVWKHENKSHKLVFLHRS